MGKASCIESGYECSSLASNSYDFMFRRKSRIWQSFGLIWSQRLGRFLIFSSVTHFIAAHLEMLIVLYHSENERELCS